MDPWRKCLFRCVLILIRLYACHFSHVYMFLGFLLLFVFSGYALSHTCPELFCPPKPWKGLPQTINGSQSIVNNASNYNFNQDDLAILSSVAAGFWYGGGFANSGSDSETWVRDPAMNGQSNVPILMMYGAEDQIYESNEGSAMGTYNQWEADTKAICVFSDLDADAIVDRSMTSLDSPEAVRAGVDRVVESITLWLDGVLACSADEASFVADDGTDDSFCNAIQQQVGEEHIELCLSQNEIDDDDSVPAFSWRTAAPVAAFGFMTAALLALAVKRERGNAAHASSHNHQTGTISLPQEKRKVSFL